MAREGKITQVTAEQMESMRKQIQSLRHDLDEDFETQNKIVNCMEILDDIISYIADRDRVARADVSISALRYLR